jgi:aminopeptidase N
MEEPVRPSSRHFGMTSRLLPETSLVQRSWTAPRLGQRPDGPPYVSTSSFFLLSSQRKGITMKTTALVLALLLLASVVCFGQRYRVDAEAKTRMFSKIQQHESLKSLNQDMFDVKYYGLDIRIDPSSKTVSGSVTVTAKVVGDSIRQMDLNLSQNMTVQAATIAGKPVSFSRPANMVTISLDRKYTKGEAVSAVVVYGGTPSDNFWFTMWNGQWLTSSLSEPYGARNWWPCKDYPSDKADSADIRVRVPSNMVVASNGTLRAVLDSGTTKTYCWEERYPIASYLISVAIHPYTTSSDYYRYSPADSMEVKYYVLPGHEAQAAPYNAKTVDMIRIFSEMFGEYPFVKEKY